MSEATKKAKPIRCVVTSDKMNKSRVGTVERLVKHRAIWKIHYGGERKLMFHDAENSSQMGDTVLVKQSSPYSARKKFELIEVVVRNVD